MDDLMLTGRDSSSMVHVEYFNCDLHPEVVPPLEQLLQAALQAGQNLAVASAYRSFERQLTIWNAKAQGERPVLDKHGRALNLTPLTDWEKVQAILTWSALPGASRHHWGTDLDVYNPACLPEGYQLQLTQTEYSTGILCDFNRWLGEYLNRGPSDFFRPYQQDNGGVLPEPWHISYRPLADTYQAKLTKAVLADALNSADLLLKACVLDHLEEILTRYVWVAS